MDEIWERWKLFWDWCGRVAAAGLVVCVGLYWFRCHLAGRIISKSEFGHFLLGLANYILS
jgi:hypothetical protein